MVGDFLERALFHANGFHVWSYVLTEKPVIHTVLGQLLVFEPFVAELAEFVKHFLRDCVMTLSSVFKRVSSIHDCC